MRARAVPVVTGRHLKRGCECTSSICLTACGWAEQAEPARSMSSEPACSCDIARRGFSRKRLVTSASKAEFSFPRHSAEHSHRCRHEQISCTVKTAAACPTWLVAQAPVFESGTLSCQCCAKGLRRPQLQCLPRDHNHNDKFVFAKCVEFHSATPAHQIPCYGASVSSW